MLFHPSDVNIYNQGDIALKVSNGRGNILAILLYEYDKFWNCSPTNDSGNVNRKYNLFWNKIMQNQSLRVQLTHGCRDSWPSVDYYIASVIHAAVWELGNSSTSTT